MTNQFLREVLWVTRLRKGLLILGMLALLACVLGTPANAQGDDLSSAARKGDLPRVRALLDSKADVNARGKQGFTALM